MYNAKLINCYKKDFKTCLTAYRESIYTTLDNEYYHLWASQFDSGGI